MLTSRRARLAQLAAPHRPWWRFLWKGNTKKEDEDVEMRPVGQQVEREEEEGEREEKCEGEEDGEDGGGGGGGGNAGGGEVFPARTLPSIAAPSEPVQAGEV